MSKYDFTIGNLSKEESERIWRILYKRYYDDHDDVEQIADWQHGDELFDVCIDHIYECCDRICDDVIDEYGLSIIGGKYTLDIYVNKIECRKCGKELGSCELYDLVYEEEVIRYSFEHYYKEHILKVAKRCDCLVGPKNINLIKETNTIEKIINEECTKCTEKISVFDIMIRIGHDKPDVIKAVNEYMTKYRMVVTAENVREALKRLKN